MNEEPMKRAFIVERSQCLKSDTGKSGTYARPAWSAAFSSREKAGRYLKKVVTFDREGPNHSRIFEYTIREEYFDPTKEFCDKVLEDWTDRGTFVEEGNTISVVYDEPVPLLTGSFEGYNALGTRWRDFPERVSHETSVANFEGKFKVGDIVRIVFEEPSLEQCYGIKDGVGVVYTVPTPDEPSCWGLMCYRVGYVNSYGRWNREFLPEQYVAPYLGELPDELAFLKILPQMFTGELKISNETWEDIEYQRALVQKIVVFDFSRDYDVQLESNLT